MIDNGIKTMVFNAFNDLAPVYLSDLFTIDSDSHLRPLRNTSTDLQIPNQTSNNCQSCFLCIGAKSWNGLPREILQASSLPAFKVKLD